MAADDTTACSPPCTAPPDASVTIQHESLPYARTPRAGTRAADTCREAATARGNCRANVRGTRTSIDALKNARAGDVCGAEKIQPEAKWNAGFITRGSIAKRSQAYFGYPGAGGIAPCSSWGLSVRSRTTLHFGAKAGPTPPSPARFLFLYLRGVGAGGALAPSR
jgi:hypothetical protein